MSNAHESDRDFKVQSTENDVNNPRVDSQLRPFNYQPSVVYTKNGTLVAYVESNNISLDGNIYIKEICGSIGTNAYQVSSTQILNQYPHLDADKNTGKYALVWSAYSQSTTITLNVYKPSKELLTSVNVYATSLDAVAVVSILPSDKVAIAYNDFDASQMGIYTRVYDRNGKAVSFFRNQNVLQVNINDRYDQNNPQISSLVPNQYVVIWTNQKVDGTYDVRGRIIMQNRPGSTTDFIVNNNTIGSQLYPSVASFANGNFIVTWTGNTFGDETGIFTQLFDKDANKIGQELLINQHTLFKQHSSKVRVSDSDIVISWIEGRRQGLYAQLFTIDANAYIKPRGNELTLNYDQLTNYTSYDIDYQNNTLVAAWTKPIDGGIGVFKLCKTLSHTTNTGSKTPEGTQEQTITLTSTLEDTTTQSKTKRTESRTIENTQDPTASQTTTDQYTLDQSDTATKTQVKTETKTKTKTKKHSDTKYTRTQQNTLTLSITSPQTLTISNTFSSPKTHTDSTSKSGTGTNTETLTAKDTASTSFTQNATATDTNTNSETDPTTTISKTEPVSHSTSESNTGTNTEQDTKTQTLNESATVTQSNSDTDTISRSQTLTKESSSSTQSQTHTDSTSKSSTGTNTETLTAKDTATLTAPQTETKTSPQTRTDTATATESGLKTKTEPLCYAGIKLECANQVTANYNINIVLPDNFINVQDLTKILQNLQLPAPCETPNNVNVNYQITNECRPKITPTQTESKKVNDTPTDTKTKTRTDTLSQTKSQSITESINPTLTDAQNITHTETHTLTNTVNVTNTDTGIDTDKKTNTAETDLITNTNTKETQSQSISKSQSATESFTLIDEIGKTSTLSLADLDDVYVKTNTTTITQPNAEKNAKHLCMTQLYQYDLVAEPERNLDKSYYPLFSKIVHITPESGSIVYGTHWSEQFVIHTGVREVTIIGNGGPDKYTFCSSNSTGVEIEDFRKDDIIDFTYLTDISSYDQITVIKPNGEQYVPH